MVTWEFIFDCLLMVLMIHMASKAPMLERRQTMFVAALLTANWVLFNLAWIRPVAPAHLVRLIGIPAEHSDAWMVTDAIAGALILGAAAEYRWAIVLWGLLFCQVVVTYLNTPLTDPVRDALFYLQAGVFLFFRGGGIGSLRHRFHHSFIRPPLVSRSRASQGDSG